MTPGWMRGQEQRLSPDADRVDEKESNLVGAWMTTGMKGEEPIVGVRMSTGWMKGEEHIVWVRMTTGWMKGEEHIVWVRMTTGWMKGQEHK